MQLLLLQLCERNQCRNTSQCCCWQNREEKRSQDSLESGPSNSKRRHKSSPLR